MKLGCVEIHQTRTGWCVTEFDLRGDEPKRLRRRYVGSNYEALCVKIRWDDQISHVPGAFSS